MSGVELLGKEYGYVVLVLVLYCFLNFWMASQVAKARKNCVINNEIENNCLWVQRGHQNSLEFMPMFFMLMILGGIRHPLICASLGASYIVTRFFYFKGYSTGDPQQRLSIG
ncbi:hypothetical protein BUALT_Bualt11G0035600 [Buddleja alternifolia]|uniref:Microsomal glutathione S-transferase 3 n=1 Tax=Buddleja alternifolia TaxID=168488 RepID=A0AAV6WSA6_9LAMI|nr:hypothetical protein BUALT_Bualt11G0035600 [Buddleja alternifolia]